MPRPTPRSLVYKTAVGAVVVGGSIYLGQAVANGSWQVFIALAAVAFSVAALQMGPRIIGVVVLGLAALPLYSQSYHAPLLWFAVLLWLVTAVGESVRKSEVPRLALGVPEMVLPALFLIGALLSNLTGSETVVQDVASKTLALGAGVAVYYLVAYTFTDCKWHNRALLGLAFGAVGILAIGGIQMVVPSLTLPGMFSANVSRLSEELGRATVRFTGPLGDYELMAEMLGLSALVLLASVARARGAMRWVLAVLSGAAVVGVFITGTRGGVVVLLVGGLFLLLKQRSLTAHRAFPVGVVVAVALAVGVAIALPDTGATLERLSSIRFGGDFAATLNRASVWPAFVTRVAALPNVLLGNGVEFDFRGIGTYPHSLYLYLLYTQGVAGLAVFGALIVRLASPIVRVLREAVPWDSLSLAPLLVIVFAVDEVKIEFTRLYGYQLWVWALLGLAASAIALRRRATAEEVKA